MCLKQRERIWRVLGGLQIRRENDRITCMSMGSNETQSWNHKCMFPRPILNISILTYYWFNSIRILIYYPPVMGLSGSLCVFIRCQANVKWMQLPRGDCQLTFLQWSNCYPCQIWRRLGLGSISTKLAFSLVVFPNLSNIGLEIIVAATSRRSEHFKSHCYASNSLPLWGPGRLNSSNGER